MFIFHISHGLLIYNEETSQKYELNAAIKIYFIPHTSKYLTKLSNKLSTEAMRLAC